MVTIQRTYNLSFRGNGFDLEAVKTAATALWDARGDDHYHELFDCRHYCYLIFIIGNKQEKTRERMPMAVTISKVERNGKFQMYQQSLEYIENLFYELADMIEGRELGATLEIIKQEQDEEDGRQ